MLDHIVGYTVTGGWKADRELAASSYEHSAQIATIAGRGAHSFVQINQPYNFLLMHNEYVHPRYVLQNKNVTLMGITPTHAFFCISDPSCDLLDTKA